MLDPRIHSVLHKLFRNQRQSNYTKLISEAVWEMVDWYTNIHNIILNMSYNSLNVF